MKCKFVEKVRYFLGASGFGWLMWVLEVDNCNGFVIFKRFVLVGASFILQNGVLVNSLGGFLVILFNLRRI